MRKVKITVDDSGAAFASTVNPPCDGCKGLPTDAVIYCIDCGKKMCEDHLEAHKTFIQMQEEDHEMILMADYQLAPTRYQKTKCPQHSKYRLIEACDICFKTFCSRCTTREKCPKDDESKDHHIVPLPSLAEKLRKMVTDVNQKLYEKMQRCRKVEKSAWRKFSDAEDHIHRVHKEVDQAADELISEVRRQANMVKDQFSGYLNVMSDRVFDFSEDLLTKIAGHDSVFMSGQRVANQSTDTEVLENVHDVINQIQQNIDEGSSEKQFELVEVNLIKGAPSLDLGLKYQAVPTALKLVNSLTEERMLNFSVSWMPADNEILCAKSGSISVLDSKLRVLCNEQLPNSVYSSISYNGGIISRVVLDNTGNKNYKLYFGSKETPAKEVLCEVPYFRGYPYTKVGACGATVAIISGLNEHNHILKIYYFARKQFCHLFDIPLEDMQHPHGVCVMNDEFVLVTDSDGGEMRKYKIQANSEPVWAVGGLTSPYGVSYCPDSELIYTSSALSGERIYVHTSEGELVKELEIDCQGFDVAVRGNQIAVAGFTAGVRLYELVY